MSTTWPNTVLATKLVQESPISSEEFLGRRFFPLNTQDYPNQSIRYKRLKAVTGATQPHSLEATVIKPVVMQGLDDVTLDANYWKELASINEGDILKLADVLDERVLLSKTGRLFAMRAMQLDRRINTRMEIDTWLAARNGYKDGLDVGGKTIKIDYGIAAPTAASVAWATIASAKIMNDIYAGVEAMQGTGALYVDVVMPVAAAKLCVQNAEVRDLAKQSLWSGQLGIGNIGQLMKTLLQGENGPVGGPAIRDVIVYAGSYVADGGAVTKYLDDGIVHMFGSRTGAQVDALVPQEEMLGEWASVPHVSSSGMSGNAFVTEAGKFLKVNDETAKRDFLEMIAGIYGATAVYHPEWVYNIDITP